MATEFHNLQELRHSASLVTKAFIQRDYSEGTVCRFQAKFPSELDNRIERTLLEETVKTLNGYYAEAEKVGGRSYLEGCLACATAYTVFFCMETRYEKVLRKISGFIQEQNEKIFAPRGLLLTDPIERGMRVVSFAPLPLSTGQKAGDQHLRGPRLRQLQPQQQHVVGGRRPVTGGAAPGVRVPPQGQRHAHQHPHAET
ncbi:golgin subfamily A member 7B isoform X2 [Betta splendens]|uniref:Golgin subfamily A member 7B isoform X2 n=1 Tax=Betta splendens TaxID=158456 RepID=A0A9W2X9P5_BETSP|nr:golgin subfamily A member 7B isoform X2 [Betta splendens]